MEEDKIDLGGSGGMKIESKSKVGKWFENYFYYYKWHTLIAIGLIFAITFCTVQICRRETYDSYILYAGSYDIRGSKKESDADLSEYTRVYKSLLEAVRDFDENGKKTASFESLYMLSNDEILALEKELADKKANGEEAQEINLTLISENNKTFKERMVYGEYYVCILSSSLYDAYKSIDGVAMFVPLTEYVEDGNSVEYLDDCAIYLKSLDFASLPGMENMPEDTVVTLRTKSAVSSRFNKKKNNEYYERSIEVIKNIINYENS